MIAPIAQIVVLLWIPIMVSWQVTGIALIVASMLLFPLKLFRRRIYSYGQVNASTNNNFTTAVQESLQNVRLVTSYANEGAVKDRLKWTFNDLRDAFIRLQFTQTAIHAAHQPVGFVVVFVTFLTAQALKIPLAEVAVVLYAFNRMTGTIANINESRSHLISWYPAYEQVIKARDGAEAASLTFGNRPLRRLEDEIRLSSVSFSYSAHTRILPDIDLTIPAGKMTALVGASGAGKSTVADLIMGLQRASSGSLSIDGVLIEDIDIHTYRSALGYVPQQTSLFNASIRDNITWSRPTASEEEILAACRLANADSFIREMEDGLDTVIGDGGTRLSGGQAQRISLARALVRKPSLLILDEATSALDTESEKCIQNAIDGILGQTTIVVIAHRLSTIAKADNIVVMDHGRIVEEGRYDDLIAKDGVFAHLAANQKL
jgi:ABC-type multidrug transport system fused ATPase/permease subunit